MKQKQTLKQTVERIIGKVYCQKCQKMVMPSRPIDYDKFCPHCGNRV